MNAKSREKEDSAVEEVAPPSGLSKLQVRLIAAGVLLILLVAWAVTSHFRAKRDAARHVQATLVIKNMLMAIQRHQMNHGGRFPKSLSDVAGIDSVAGEELFNPFTQSSPGFEYEFPGQSDGLWGIVRPDGTQAELKDTPLIYQLRDGERVMDAAIGFADGSVRRPSEE